MFDFNKGKGFVLISPYASRKSSEQFKRINIPEIQDDETASRNHFKYSFLKMAKIRKVTFREDLEGTSLTPQCGMYQY